MCLRHAVVLVLCLPPPTGPCLHLLHHGTPLLQRVPLTANPPHGTRAVEDRQQAAGAGAAEQAE